MQASIYEPIVGIVGCGCGGSLRVLGDTQGLEGKSRSLLLTTNFQRQPPCTALCCTSPVSSREEVAVDEGRRLVPHTQLY